MEFRKMTNEGEITWEFGSPGYFRPVPSYGQDLYLEFTTKDGSRLALMVPTFDYQAMLIAVSSNATMTGFTMEVRNPDGVTGFLKDQDFIFKRISPSMVASKKFQELVRMIQEHDWYHMMSDDDRVHQAGERHYRRIWSTYKELASENEKQNIRWLYDVEKPSDKFVSLS